MGKPTPSWRDDPLAALIGAGAAGRFLSDIYEKEAFVSHADQPGRFAGLISIDDVDRIVTSTDMRDGELMLADAAKGSIDKSSYVDNHGFVDRGAVAKAYRRGATIILNQAQRIVPALGQLCQGLEHAFSAHIQTNLYLTPPDAQGFGTHFDNHDVFVIQAEGEKLWRLYDVPLDLPFRGERYQSSIHQAGELRSEFTLKAGDCAYVPRGMMHDASTSGSGASLHITVGLITKTWADLMLEAVSEVALSAPEFRRSLPPGFANGEYDMGQAEEQMAALAAILTRKLKAGPAMDLLRNEFIRSRPAINRATISEAARAVLHDEGFVRAAYTPFRIVQDGADGITLIAPGSELAFTQESEAALRKALSGERFSANTLAFEHADPLIRRLLDYGLIQRTA